MRISDWSSDVCSSDLSDLNRKARESRCTGPWLEARASRARASCGRIRLTLRELGGAACLVQTDLLALDLACVAGHEARRAQLALERLVVLDQRAGDAQADRTGLAGGAAAAGGDETSDGRRVGKECVSTCRSRWPRAH